MTYNVSYELNGLVQYEQWDINYHSQLERMLEELMLKEGVENVCFYSA